MKKLHLLLAIGALAFATGCFQSDTVVSVKPDGSGTVTESFVLGKTALAQFKQMTESFAAAMPGEAKTNAGAKPFDIMDEKKLRANAAKMGEGVTFVSAKGLTNSVGEGYTVTYAFKDINKLKVNQNKSDSMPEGPGGAEGGMGGKPESKQEYITFQFKPGPVAELTVRTPAKPADAAKKTDKSETPEGSEEMAMQMMSTMFKDMKVSVAIEVAGKIEKTDAEYVEGSKVTLMAMDFNKVLADPAKFKALAKADPQSLEETKKVMHSVPGMKAELKDTVKISFK